LRLLTCTNNLLELPDPRSLTGDGRIKFRTGTKSYTAYVDSSKLQITLEGLAKPFLDVLGTTQKQIGLVHTIQSAFPTQGGFTDNITTSAPGSSIKANQNKRARTSTSIENAPANDGDDQTTHKPNKGLLVNRSTKGNTETRKRYRLPSRGMSSRELGSLFNPHDKRKGVDDSLGSDYKEESRSSRASSVHLSRQSTPVPPGRSASEDSSTGQSSGVANDSEIQPFGGTKIMGEESPPIHIAPLRVIKTRTGYVC